MTKLELEHKNARLQIQIDQYVGIDENRRKEFAKAFNWVKVERYGISDEYRTPSWEEIFIEVGKLLVKDSTLDTQEKLQRLSDIIDNLITENCKGEPDIKPFIDKLYSTPIPINK